MVEIEVNKRLIAERHHCPNCGQSYKYKGGLRRHQDFECGKKPQFLCPLCPKQFSRKDKLLRHRKNVHRSKEIGTFNNEQTIGGFVSNGEYDGDE